MTVTAVCVHVCVCVCVCVCVRKGIEPSPKTTLHVVLKTLTSLKWHLITLF